MLVSPRQARSNFLKSFQPLLKNIVQSSLASTNFFRGFIVFCVVLFLLSGALFASVLIDQGNEVLKSDALKKFINRYNNPTYLSIPFNYVQSFLISPLETLHIDIKFKNYQKIVEQRQKALDNGVIKSESKEYVKAKIRYQGTSIPVKLRLKGTWTDHVNSEKWSFTIKVSKNNSIFSMKKFSIQHPKTRNFTREWLFLNALGREGIIAVHYDFVNVVINGKDKGIYALEGGFSKELLEHQQRREGIILQFDEELRRNQPGDDDYLPVFHDWHSSHITAYKMKKIKSNKKLYAQFLEGQALLEQFRQGTIPSSNVFDCKLFGRYFALLDMFGGGNGTHWNNLRFYYNPITSQIEPIGRDAQTGILRNIVGDLSGYQYYRALLDPFEPRKTIHNRFFSDPVFFNCYMKELVRVSSQSYFDQLKNELKPEYERKVRSLHREWPYLSSRFDFIEANQKSIRAILNPLAHVDSYTTLEKTFPDGSRKVRLDIGNLLSLPVEVQAATFVGENLLKKNKTVYLPAKSIYQATQYRSIHLIIPKKFKTGKLELKVHTRIVGTDRLIKTLSNAPRNLDNSFIPSLPAPNLQDISTLPFLKADLPGKTLTIKMGKWVIREDLIIPTGYQLVVEPGTELAFHKDQALISYSPVVFKGKPNQPIRLTAASGSWAGMTVINAEGLSILEEVIIEKTKGIERGGWQNPGGVTFYKSPVKIVHTQFRDNQSEDALNIVSSNFLVSDSRFDAIFSDALDSDFSNGTIEKTFFQTVGNDALDFSGSQVSINNVSIRGAGDKGISAGEKSIIHVQNTRVTESNIGVASKDLSVTRIENSSFVRNNIGLTVYQKKLTYGPGRIFAKNILFEENKETAQVETNSYIEIDDVRHKGDKTNLANILTKKK